MQRPVFVRSHFPRMPVHQHGVTCSGVQSLLLSVGFFEYRQISEYHDCARDPEGYGAGYDCVGLVDLEFAAQGIVLPPLYVLVGCVPAHEYRRVRYGDRTQPRRRQHDERHLPRKRMNYVKNIKQGLRQDEQEYCYILVDSLAHHKHIIIVSRFIFYRSRLFFRLFLLGTEFYITINI